MQRVVSPAAELAIVAALTAMPLAAEPPAASTLESIPILAGTGAGTATPGLSAPLVDTARQNRLVWPIEPDDASFALVRSHLDRRSLPPAEAIRIAELANAFDDAHPPAPAYAVGLTAEVFPSPTRPGYHVLSLVLRGAAAGARHGAIFVVVVEGLVAGEPRIREALRMLAGALDDRDRLGIVAHGPRGRMVLEPTLLASRLVVERTIRALRRGGAPDLVAGLQLGYDLADRSSAASSGSGPASILLLSGGAGFRPPAEALFDDVRRQARAGRTLSVVGFPGSGYDDRLMARLARHGDGRYAVADNPAAARRLFSRLPDSLAVVAREVTGRLELDPETVARFRLLGDPSGSGNAAGAGSLAAGSRATALIELQLTGRPGALGTVQVRYRAAMNDLSPPLPSGGPLKQLEMRLPSQAAGLEASDGHLLLQEPGTSGGLLRWIAATFGEKLGGSYWTRDVSYGRLLRLFRFLDPGLRTEPRTAELRYLIQQARRLGQPPPRQDPQTRLPSSPRPTGDVFDRLRVIE